MSAKFIWHKTGNFIGDLEAASKRKTLELARKVFEGVVEKTPVRTGSARASWNATVGVPITRYVRGASPENTLPPPVFPLSTLSGFDKVYITNGSPYIMELEYGSSKQAPQGMIRVTLASLGVKFGI